MKCPVCGSEMEPILNTLTLEGDIQRYPTPYMRCPECMTIEQDEMFIIGDKSDKTKNILKENK